ncbi:hypothetical protein RZQ49_26840 [Klebsiella michiganensis]|uniref:hypothetical protein n=1 Tax=Klebsiella TaxID=570 RepID=UPI0007CD19D6|nr:MULTISPECIES: hypothetical protein [Klebsiella]MDV1434472.1 hypothetical protein [Klebsiella michiganensis]MDZ0184908.1 hypothetical protein [Klebsiella quasipneumoniae]SAX86742.1 Uncharacterised protein [Klebsiella pneumoniae]
MKRVIFFLLIMSFLYIVTLSATLMLSQHEYYENINKSIENAFSSASGSPEYNKSLISHRMISSDLNEGLISFPKANEAFSNTAGYLNEVNKKCTKENTPQINSFLSCANQLLGEHFYYYPARETAIAWAGHYSDCDSNVYLLLDALSLINKTASIVYAPGHAFLSWIDEATGAPVWWETTLNSNHGGIADLTWNDLYPKTMAPFYYHPQTAVFAETFYRSVVTIKSLSEEKRRKQLDKILRLYPDNPLVEDIKLEQQTSFTNDDISRIEDYLNTDISSVTKKQLLAHYYQKKGNSELAEKYISKIDISSCNTECRHLMIKFTPFNSFWFMVSDKLKKNIVHNSYGEFDVSKRPYPVSTIKEKTETVNNTFILIIFALGVMFLCTGIKSERSEQI